jgi:hypothetical protein
MIKYLKILEHVRSGSFLDLKTELLHFFGFKLIWLLINNFSIPTLSYFTRTIRDKFNIERRISFL